MCLSLLQEKGGMKKECYGVDSEEELVRAREAARQEGAWSGTLAKHSCVQTFSDTRWWNKSLKYVMAFC